jgi:hypothetical protein
MQKVMMVVLCAVAATAHAESWKPAPGHLMTRWAKDVDPRKPLPEYPRPQMVRPDWINLNGLWDYAIRDGMASQPKEFDGQILVPFPVESALSGVKKPLEAKERLWYRRQFDSPELNGKRLILHFGAVDWEATVWVNGKELGTHRGGYDGFSFDVTDAVKPGRGNELVVAVRDTTGANGEPRGKQQRNAIEKPEGIMYTPCSGIWQTVWLESVPGTRVVSLRITPLEDLTGVSIQATLTGSRCTVKFEAMEGERVVASSTSTGNSPLAPDTVTDGFLKIPNAKLWSPDSPFLYGLRITLIEKDQPLDAVESYFGMRKIALARDEKGFSRILLNNRFVFQSGPLDQGFWPDGIYTAPTDEALRYDIEMTKKLGMNMCRKHVKVEPERWYYWCDKLGLLVWQDMPSAGAGRNAGKDSDGEAISPERAKQFETELAAMVDHHVNHPSIVMWVVFNEGWGQYDTSRLTKWVKEHDPSRLVNNASGWNDRHCGDVCDLHSYPGPGCPDPGPARAAVLGEFGGLGLATEGHMWVVKSWGYRQMSGRRMLTRRFLDLWKHVQELRDEKGLCAAVYTQTTDVETEANGLMTYDREVVKVDADACAAAIARGQFPPEPQVRTVVPTAKEDAATWQYTTKKPGDDWFKPGFDAGNWKTGPGGFGTRNTPGTVVNTEWKTDDIWVRREVTLPDGPLGNLMLQMHHDENAEAYLNGVLAAKASGYTTQYEPAEIAPDAARALRPGKNLLAIHCHQTMGGQYIDAGIVETKER